MRKEANDLIEGKTKVIKNKHISAYAQSKIDRLEQENTKLRIALCNLRDEYLDMGGDVNQLELFDTTDYQTKDRFGNSVYVNTYELRYVQWPQHPISFFAYIF